MMFALINLGYTLMATVDRDSSVGVATLCGLDWSGDRIPVGAKFLAPV